MRHGTTKLVQEFFSRLRLLTRRYSEEARLRESGARAGQLLQETLANGAAFDVLRHAVGRGGIQLSGEESLQFLSAKASHDHYLYRLFGGGA
jgi:hypothetical protein